MTAAQFELLDEAQAQRILSWRFEALSKAGYDASDALMTSQGQNVVDVSASGSRTSSFTASSTGLPVARSTTCRHG